MHPTITSSCLDDTLLTSSSQDGVVSLSIHNFASVALMFKKFGGEDFASAEGGTPLLVAQPSRCCYYGMHLEGGIAASFSLDRPQFVSAITVVLHTASDTKSPMFEFSLERRLSKVTEIYAVDSFTPERGTVGPQVLEVDRTLPAGDYLLVGRIPGYMSEEVTTGYENGWWVSSGECSGVAGKIHNGVWMESTGLLNTESAAPSFLVSNGEVERAGRDLMTVWALTRPRSGGWVR